MNNFDNHLFLDDEPFFKNEEELIADPRLKQIIYDTVYYDLISMGPAGYKRRNNKIVNERSKVRALNRLINFYEEGEDYEKCAKIKKIHDDI